LCVLIILLHFDVLS